MWLRILTNFRNSLLFRLTVLFSTAFVILAAVGFSVFYYRIHSFAIEEMDSEMYLEAQAYAKLLAHQGFEAVRKQIVLEMETEDPAEEFFRLLNSNGDLLTATDMTDWGEVDYHMAMAKIKKQHRDHIVMTIRVPDHDYKARVITAVIGPSVLFQKGETLEGIDDYLGVFRDLLVFLIGSLIVASALIGWILAKRALADMAEVTRTAEEISQGSYSRRVSIKGQFKEIGRLGAAFNIMLDRIQHLLESMQQINDNIAHDLRSPLARIRGIAEMTIVKNNSIEDFREMAVSTIEECDTLIDMINTMLDIAEIEAGINNAEVEEFELTALVSEACDLFAPIAREKQIRLKADLQAPISFRGNKKRMQRVVTNIIENAIKYTPHKGSVRVSLRRDGEIVRIDVKDSGNGISAKDLPYIFNRFYRCDRSRSRGGVGLGLSLVKAYTESMKGHVSVKSDLNQGSVFTLRFAQ